MCFFPFINYSALIYILLMKFDTIVSKHLSTIYFYSPSIVVDKFCLYNLPFHVYLHGMKCFICFYVMHLFHLSNITTATAHMLVKFLELSSGINLFQICVFTCSGTSLFISSSFSKLEFLHPLSSDSNIHYSHRTIPLKWTICHLSTTKF